MLNSSEEHSYWYLRLNGFFLLDNFVIHKSEGVDYTSDADILAIRPPFIYEDIGGRADDWDSKFLSQFAEDAIIGIICQVKGGAIGDKELFREPYLSYSIKRFGFTKDIAQIIEQLNQEPIATLTNELGTKYQVAKVLVTRDKPKGATNFLTIPLPHIYDFIFQRINKYPIEKYRDRNFFSSVGLQTIIEINSIQKGRQDEDSGSR